MQNASVQKQSFKWNSNLIALLSLGFILFLYIASTMSLSSMLTNQKLQLFKAMFISIIIEALPFILIGVLISSLLHVFVSEQMIKRLIPKNPILGIIVASVLGIIFPICECGMVPAIRRLIQKGMPLYVATTFLVVGPILNPIVFWSTFTAFRHRQEMTISRMGLAFVLALIIGLIVARFVKTDQLKESHAPKHDHHHEHDHHHDHGSHSHSLTNKLTEVMSNSVSEFFEMGKYLIFGALLVALLQTFVSRSELLALGHGAVGSNVLMMGLGFLLSLCSTSDAFVAQSFLTTFTKGSLVAFMVLGPMLNLKGLLMMLAVFKPRFVALYSVLVVVCVFCGTTVLEWLFLR